MGLVGSETLQRLAYDHGFSTVGVAPALPIDEALAVYRSWLAAGFHGEMDYMARHESLKADPSELLPGAKSVVVLTANYYQNRPDDPKIARYALGRDYHKVLHRRAQRMMSDVMTDHPGHTYRICVDSAPILERAYANLAGIGWFGKNTMLIDSRRGSWFFLAAVLTTVEFQPDHPVVGGCGTCRACIDACPTGAIVQLEGRWQIDARRCISYQTIEKKGDLEVDTAGWTFGCDVCQEVCPFNQPRESQPLRARPTTLDEFAPRPIPVRSELERLNWAAWDRLTQGSAIRRAGFDALKRNAKAALGSSRDPLDD